MMICMIYLVNSSYVSESFQIAQVQIYLTNQVNPGKSYALNLYIICMPQIYKRYFSIWVVMVAY